MGNNRLVCLCCSVVLLLVSCSSKENRKKKLETPNSVELIKPQHDTPKESEKVNGALETLSKMQHFSKEEFIAWAPENIKGLPKTHADANIMVGIGQGMVNYGKSSDKHIELMIIDGAGPNGASAVAPYRSIKDRTFTEKNEYGHTRMTQYEGTAVKEVYSISSKEYVLSFFYAERFGLQLKVTGFPQSELWNIFKEFNLERLIK